MTSISVKLDALLSKINEMKSNDVKNITLTIHQDTVDQNDKFSGFLYFEGYKDDCLPLDYESIDAISKPNPNISNITFIHQYNEDKIDETPKSKLEQAGG